MRKDCANEMQLSPKDLKDGVVAALNKLLAPIQEEFKSSEEFQKIEKLAYPPEVKAKKDKAPKKIGNKYKGKATGEPTEQSEGQNQPKEAAN
jgi:tyrosyl-tRNA synthetase